MLLFCKGGDIVERKPVYEKIAFNNIEGNQPFYIDCIHRKINKKTPQAIYHYHENIELLYCVEGELEVTLSKTTVILNPGDFLYLAPNTLHATSSHRDTNEHICVKFIRPVIQVPSSRKIPPVDYFISLISSYEVFRSDPADCEYIRGLFFNCIDNYSHDDYFKRLVLQASIMQIMSYVFLHTLGSKAKETPKSIPDVFMNVLGYIDSNCATVTLEEAANYCSLSYSYFSRTFKSIFAVSFSNYVIKRRVEKSLSLISDTNLSLNDIALECGFANLSHFIKCFNEEKGMTPKKFRAIVTKR